MENLIIQNLLEQVEKLKQENKKLIEENTRLKNGQNEIPIIKENIIKETPENKYVSIEDLVGEKYQNAMSISEFETYLKSKITEADLFECLYKEVQVVVIDVLTRELSNKEIRPIHKNKHYVVKIGDTWIKKEHYDFDKIIKRLINIVVHTMNVIFISLRKTELYINGGAGLHKYKHYSFDREEFSIKLMDDLNNQVISKTIGNRIHINL